MVKRIWNWLKKLLGRDDVQDAIKSIVIEIISKKYSSVNSSNRSAIFGEVLATAERRGIDTSKHYATIAKAINSQLDFQIAKQANNSRSKSA